MATDIVSFISSKGGSGKTVTSFSMGQILSSLGFKVLLVDADASTNGLTLLTLPSVAQAKSEHDEILLGLFDTHDPEYVSAPLTLQENLDLFPATYHMSNTENYPVEMFRKNLLRVLKGRADAYDFVFIDAQAGIDPFAKAAVAVSGQSVIVSEYDPSSVQGIERLKVIFADVLRPGNSWILFNKILPEFGRAIGDGLIVARYLPPIIWDAHVVRSVATRENPINFKNPNDYTLALAGTISRLLGARVRDAVAGWLRSTKESVTLPIKSKLDQVTGELQNILSRQVKMRDESERAKRASWVGASGTGVAIVGSFTAIFTKFTGDAGPRSSVEFLLFSGLGLLGLIGFFFVLAFTDAKRTRARNLEQELIALKRLDLERERERLIAGVDSAEAALRLSESYRPN